MMGIEFAGDFNQLLKYIEGFVYNIAYDIVKLPIEKQKAMGLFKLDISRLAKVKPVFPKITYKEAIEKLGLNYGDDISSKKEAELVSMYEEYPIFITCYPNPLWNHGKESEVEKFFNMLPDKETLCLVLPTDLILLGAGEVVGSAARVDDPETLVDQLTRSKMYNRLVEMGGNLDDFKWCIEHSREKMVPRADCGFGMSRILKWISGHDDIKQSVTFASNQHRII